MSNESQRQYVADILSISHLTEPEISCRDSDKTPYPFSVRKLTTLMVAFESVRAAVGSPIAVSSGFRTPEHNASVGGAKRSYHVRGMALDLQCPRGFSLAKFQDIVRGVALNSKVIGGLGFYPWGCHIDIREKRNSVLTTWHSGNRRSRG